MSRVKQSAAPRCGVVYVFFAPGHGYKIGASWSAKERRASIARTLGTAVTPIHTIRTYDVMGAEAHFHEVFAEKRIQGEWFNLSTEDVEWLRGHKEWDTGTRAVSVEIEDLDEWFSAEEVSQRLGVSQTRVRRLVAQGRLKAHKISANNFFHQDEIDRFLREAAEEAPKRRGPLPKALRAPSPSRRAPTPGAEEQE